MDRHSKNYSLLKPIIDAMPNPTPKGMRQLSLEELTLRLAKLGILSDAQIAEIVQLANAHRCIPKLTVNKTARVIRYALIYFRKEKFARHIPRVEWAKALDKNKNKV
jgi:hypothetical protein